MAPNEYYDNGYDDYINRRPYRAPVMSLRLADSPWNDYDRGWFAASQLAAQNKMKEQVREEERKFLSE